MRQLSHALTYAAPAWWGFTTAEDKQKLQSILNRAIKWGYYDPAGPTLELICCGLEEKLFAKILSNPSHVLSPILPPSKNVTHYLRPRPHDRQLPPKIGSLHQKTFIQRMLYRDIY